MKQILVVLSVVFLVLGVSMIIIDYTHYRDLVFWAGVGAGVFQPTTGSLKLLVWGSVFGLVSLLLNRREREMML